MGGRKCAVEGQARGWGLGHTTREGHIGFTDEVGSWANWQISGMVAESASYTRMRQAAFHAAKRWWPERHGSSVGEVRSQTDWNPV